MAGGGGASGVGVRRAAANPALDPLITAVGTP